MPDTRSRMIAVFSELVVLKHRHLLRFQLKRKDVFDFNTSIPKFREDCKKAVKLFGKLPDGIAVSPVTIDGIPAEWIVPSPAGKDKVILYTHGGGYVSGSCNDHRAIVAGESAGGGLCLATLLALRDQGIPLPATAVAISPWTDLKCTGESYRTKNEVSLAPLNSWTVFSKYYVGNNDPCLPWISPLYGDLHGLPTILINVGEDDELFDDSVRFAEKAKAAGVDVKLRVGERMVHCYPFLPPFIPEARQAMDEICAFIKTHIGK